MNIAMIRPWLLIAIPIIVAIIILAGKSLRIQSKIKKTKYIVYRILVLVMLVLAMTGVSVQWMTKEVTTIFLVDLSDSTVACQSDMEAYIKKTIAAMPKKNKAGIVAFGSDALVETFVSDSKTFTEFDAKPVSTATNLENAVSTAVALFPEGSAKRLVLITDGSENEGSITNMESLVTSQKIECKVIEVDNELENEVYISDMNIPDTIHVGEKFSVKATINSTVVTNAKVSLYSGRVLKAQENVKLQVGENQFVFEDAGVENGMQSYRVVVEPDLDTISANNEYCAFTQVESTPRILIVQGENGLGTEFAKVVKAAGYNYDLITPSGVPMNMNDLTQYKCVVMIDVYYDDLTKGFPKLLQSFVKDYAGGFICIGGDDSYALGGYRATELEEILPVNMDLEGNEKIPKMALYMVIDHSGSMTMTDGNSEVTCLDLAKQAAVKGLESVRPTDEVAVISFDDSYQWTVSPQEATDIERLKTEVATIAEGGGTDIYGALKPAVEKISTSDAEIKHIILLTDGEDYNDYRQLKDQINANGITLSTVAVGADADQSTLKGLADDCGGRYYQVDINSGIPKIFAQEVFLSLDSYIRNDPFTPVVVNHHEILGDLFDEGYPQLLGYIATSPKSTATRILESQDGDPILTTWQYGLGKTVAWNSDGTNEWTGLWAKWTKYTDFWNNVIDYTVSDTALGDDTLTVKQTGSKAAITYGTKSYDANTTITGMCTDENGNQTEITFDPVAPGSYEAKIDTKEVGVYTINIRNNDGSEVVKSVNTATAMQYSPEYKLDNNRESLEEFVAVVGGEVITMEDDIFAKKLDRVQGRANLTLLFLILALVFFIIDVVSRRLNLNLVDRVAANVGKTTKKSADTVEKTTKKVKKKYKEVSEDIASSEVFTDERKQKPEKVKPEKAKKKTMTADEEASTKASADLVKQMQAVKKSKQEQVIEGTHAKTAKNAKPSKKPASSAIDVQTLMNKKKERDD